MKLSRCLVPALALLVFGEVPISRAAEPASAAEAKEQKIAWVFDIKEDAEGTPRGKVSLSVNGKKTVILEKAIGNYAVVEPATYKEKKIPAKAVTACGGWWAGSGEDFYVLNEKTGFTVYQRTVDEQGGAGKYRLVKTIAP
jgi:hypothetical protein